MHDLERVLKERAAELADELQAEVGLTSSEATRFLEEAGPALLASYRWQEGDLKNAELSSPETVRDLLAGIGGERLAPRVGLSPARTWDGLRTSVSAATRFTSNQQAASRQEIASSQQGASRRDRGGVGGGHQTSETRRDMAPTQWFDIGFGLSFEHSTDDAPASFLHPIFDRLLSRPDPGI